MRARMALYVSTRVVELREVVLRDKPSEMLALSSKGTVPILVLPDGTLLDESFDIMLWALAQNDPKGWITPLCGSYDAMVGLVRACDEEFKPHLDRYKYAGRYEGVDALEHRLLAQSYLAVLEERLAEERFLCGAQPCLADYAVMPFIRQFAHVDKAWFSTSPYQRTQSWLEGLLASEIFTNVMQKYPQWTAGQAPVLFPA